MLFVCSLAFLGNWGGGSSSAKSFLKLLLALVADRLGSILSKNSLYLHFTAATVAPFAKLLSAVRRLRTILDSLSVLENIFYDAMLDHWSTMFIVTAAHTKITADFWLDAYLFTADSCGDICFYFANTCPSRYSDQAVSCTVGTRYRAHYQIRLVCNLHR